MALAARLSGAQIDAVERHVPVGDEQLEAALLLFLQLRAVRIELGDDLRFGWCGGRFAGSTSSTANVQSARPSPWFSGTKVLTDK